MRIGICTFSDGRKRVWEQLREDCFGFQRRIAGWLREEGHEVVEGQEIIWNYAAAREEGGRMREAECDAVVFNFCVWSYPDLTVQAAQQFDAPILFIGNINPGYPGWVAFFASAGALDEVGRPFGRVLGDTDDAGVQEQVRAFLRRNAPDPRERAQAAVDALYGMRYGEFDGPSMGMYTGHIDQSQWMSQFGVHVYHRSQLTLAWLMERVGDDRVEAGLQWLKEHCGAVHFDGRLLTDGMEGSLAKQVRLYLAIKDFCREEGIDFCGLTGQLDFTEWDRGIVMDVPEALLNDVVDWEDDPKEVVICGTECDSNGALTMQLMHLLAGTPVLFADLRHYHEDLDVYDLVNSGEHAPWLSRRSGDWRENWKQVQLFPSIEMYFPCGGASVQFFSDPEETVTFGRLTRKEGIYRMHLFTGSFVRFGQEEDERLGRMTTPEWPHAFARFDCSTKALASLYSSNHIHAIMGDWRGELVAACEALEVEPVVMS